MQTQLRAQADRQIEGYIALQQARETSDWQSMELLAREALEKHPALPGVHSFVGLRLTTIVSDSFKRMHGPFELTYVGPNYLLTVPYTWPTATAAQTTPPVAEAFSWLVEARHHGDDPGGQVTAALALLYSMNNRYDATLKAIKQALSTNPGLASYFQRPVHLAMLAHACGPNVQRLREVGDAIGIKLPVPPEEVRAALELLSPTDQQHLDWYVTGQPTAWLGEDPSTFPITLRLFRGTTEEGTPGARARWMTPGKDIPDIPPEPGRYARLEDVMDEVAKRYLFVSLLQTDQGIAP
jgi:hypothetical protein